MGLKISKLSIQGKDVTLVTVNKKDYISITDIAKYRSSETPADIVKNWLRSRSTIELLGLWEKLYNPDFKLVEFDQFKNEAGANYFVLSPKKWIEKTNAIGLIPKSGRYGGTYAHKDIAFEFASWISVEFKLYLIKEFQRLKEEERKQLGWDIKRNLAVHFKLDYVNSDGDISNYYPDFLVKLTDGRIVVVETKGQEDLDVPLKIQRIRQWCEDINGMQSDVMYDFVYVDEEGFKKYEPKSFADLMASFREYKEKT